MGDRPGYLRRQGWPVRDYRGEAGAALQPEPGECDTYHANGRCDCQGVSFSGVELSRGALVSVREPIPGVPERGFFVLLDDPLGPGGTLRLARAGEDLETGRPGLGLDRGVNQEQPASRGSESSR